MLSKKVLDNLTNIYEKILGKKVLIIDFETTGLFDFKQFKNIKNNEIFKNSRIIEVGYFYTENFGENFNDVEIHSYLRTPTDFPITDINNSTDIHNITPDMILNNGSTFENILKYDLSDKLNNCDCIISHNTQFDLSILLNELFRINNNNIIRKIYKLYNKNNIICTCKATGYKKLSVLYKCIFDSEPELLHRAGNDVKTLLEIIIKKNINNRFLFTLDISNNII